MFDLNRPLFLDLPPQRLKHLGWRACQDEGSEGECGRGESSGKWPLFCPLALHNS